MAEKWKFLVFRALFLFEVYIQQWLYLTGGTLPGRKKIEHFKIRKKSIGCTKMQKYIVAGSIKGFLIIC